MQFIQSFDKLSYFPSDAIILASLKHLDKKPKPIKRSLISKLQFPPHNFAINFDFCMKKAKTFFLTNKCKKDLLSKMYINSFDKWIQTIIHTFNSILYIFLCNANNYISAYLLCIYFILVFHNKLQRPKKNPTVSEVIVFSLFKTNKKLLKTAESTKSLRYLLLSRNIRYTSFTLKALCHLLIQLDFITGDLKSAIYMADNYF